MCRIEHFHKCAKPFELHEFEIGLLDFTRHHVVQHSFYDQAALSADTRAAVHNDSGNDVAMPWTKDTGLVLIQSEAICKQIALDWFQHEISHFPRGFIRRGKRQVISVARVVYIVLTTMPEDYYIEVSEY